jgi:hypothetical protein
LSGPLSPSERLQQSREALRVALRPAAAGAPSRSSLDWLLDWVRANAGASGNPGSPLWPVLLSALTRWWAPHPAHQIGQLAHSLLQAWARPVAARHPWGLLAGSLAAGAALVLVRPWRWLPRPALLAGLLPLMWREWMRRP